MQQLPPIWLVAARFGWSPDQFMRRCGLRSRCPEFSARQGSAVNGLSMAGCPIRCRSRSAGLSGLMSSSRSISMVIYWVDALRASPAQRRLCLRACRAISSIVCSPSCRHRCASKLRRSSRGFCRTGLRRRDTSKCSPTASHYARPHHARAACRRAATRDARSTAARHRFTGVQPSQRGDCRGPVLRRTSAAHAAALRIANGDVRSYSKSGHSPARAGCPLYT